MTNTEMEIIRVAGSLPQRVQESILDLLNGAALAVAATQGEEGSHEDS